MNPSCLVEPRINRVVTLITEQYSNHLHPESEDGSCKVKSVRLARSSPEFPVCAERLQVSFLIEGKGVCPNFETLRYILKFFNFRDLSLCVSIYSLLGDLDGF